MLVMPLVSAGSWTHRKSVTIGVELVIDTEWMSTDASYSRREYDLVASVVHHGQTLAFGHYTVLPQLMPSVAHRADDISQLFWRVVLSEIALCLPTFAC